MSEEIEKKQDEEWRKEVEHLVSVDKIPSN